MKNLKNSKFKYINMLLFLLLAIYSTFSYAQTPAPKTIIRGISTEEYAFVKNYKFKDLDKDTYVKLENGLVIDRFEMKPPYVFNFSDGMERKIYLFKVIDGKDKKDLGLLAVYKNSKTTKTMNICLPTIAADKAIWGKYIDDLKDYDKVEYGFSSTMAFVLGKELASASTPAGAAVPIEGGGEYEFCFPENAPIMLADKSEIAISKLKKTDVLLTYRGDKKKLTQCSIQKLIVHRGVFNISKLVLQSKESIYASTAAAVLEIAEIEATANHPIYTTKGAKKLGEIKIGEAVICFEPATNAYKEYVVINAIANFKTVDVVYNIKTSHNANYLVNKTVVLPK